MSNKFRIVLSVIGVVISIALLVVSTILAEETLITPVLATVFIIISVILVFIAIFFVAKVDYETGVYKCRKCGHTFKPTFKAYVAERVSQLGAGVKLDKLDGFSVMTAINKILSIDTYRQNAKKIAEGFKNSSGAKGAADKIIKVCNDIKL